MPGSAHVPTALDEHMERRSEERTVEREEAGRGRAERPATAADVVDEGSKRSEVLQVEQLISSGAAQVSAPKLGEELTV